MVNFAGYEQNVLYVNKDWRKVAYFAKNCVMNDRFNEVLLYFTVHVNIFIDIFSCYCPYFYWDGVDIDVKSLTSFLTCEKYLWRSHLFPSDKLLSLHISYLYLQLTCSAILKTVARHESKLGFRQLLYRCSPSGRESPIRRTQIMSLHILRCNRILGFWFTVMVSGVFSLRTATFLFRIAE